MKNHRKLLGCSLIAAIILSVLVLPYPSLGSNSSSVAAKAQDEPVMTAHQVQGQTPDEHLSKHFRKYDLLRMDPRAVAAQVRSNGRLRLKSSARDFDLHLTPHDMRSSDYVAQVIDAKGVAHPLPKIEVNTFKGDVKGLPGAQARLSLTEQGIEGAIITKEKRYFLQPARAISKEAAADEFVLYDGADLTKEAGECAVTLADEVAAQEEATKTAAAGTDVIEAEASGPVSSLTTMKVARISTDADGEYVTAFGGASQANAQIANILNFVDGIYQVEIGITFQIVRQNTWADSASDPYSSTAPSTLLGQFRDHWNANFPNSGGDTRSIAHLFTGKNLDGTTIGIASFGVACRTPNFSYGLSQQFPTGSTSITAQTVALTAHEIGHNFGAAHTNQSNSEVPVDFEPSCIQTIMEASINSGNSFCPYSRSQIAGQAAGHSSCLTDLASAPPNSQDCTVTPLPPGGFALGTLSTSDCRSPSRGVEYFADHYSFNGVAGQRVNIVLGQGTAALDPYLYLIAPDGYVIAQDDDGNGGVSSRIPAPNGSGNFTLPQTGVYIVEATTFGRQQTGSYNVNVNDVSCQINATANTLHFPAGGGSGTINVTLSGSGCQNDPGYLVLTFPSSGWITPETTSASGNRTINFTVQSNPNQAGRRAFLLVGGVTTGPGPNDVTGGVTLPITQSGTGPDCSAIPIGFGQTLNGNISPSDCHSPVRGQNFFADRYTFNASAGQKVTIQANAGTMDTFLTLLGPNGYVLLVDDDSGGGTNSRIPGGNRSMTLGLPGTYTIEVTAFGSNTTGSYSVTLTSDSAADNVQFTSTNYTVNESQATANLTVTRTGNTASAATVNFATTDSFGANCILITGVASAKCDFNTAGGTLRFAPGETSKTIPISIINDGYIEGIEETFTVTLSNPTVTSLGAPSTATVTIFDNDQAQTNPFDSNAFFVRQQYLDFLLREPDTGGFNDWLNVLNNCPPNQGGLGSLPTCDRVHVSSGFFRSTEFGERGYWIYRYYHAALGRRPQFAEFLPDMRRLSGSLTPAEEEAARAAFVADFMQRSEFTAIYGGLTNAANAAQFIAKLEQTAGVTLPATNTTQPGQPPQFGRAELIQRMESGQFTAAQTLQAFIEQKVVFDAFFFRAFVAMQYFGYLRRDPEDAGYNDWVDVLTNGRGNIPAGDFRHLIFGFVWSVEYRQRFGP